MPEWASLTLVLVCLPAGAQNLVTNGGFDTSIAGWTVYSPPNMSMSWNAQDALAAPASGSAYVTNQHPSSGYNAGVVACANGVVGNASYDLGAKLRVPTGQSGPGSTAVQVSWWDSSGCTGNQTPGPQTFSLTTSDVWTGRSMTVAAPAQARSAWVYVAVYKTSGGGQYGAYVDDVFSVVHRPSADA